jgi:hypothetical protein
MAPFVPSSSRSMLDQLGAPAPYDARGDGSPGWDALLSWGGSGGGSEGETRRAGQAVPLFPRTELPAPDAPAAKPEAAS